jgi:hypothetical protein
MVDRIFPILRKTTDDQLRGAPAMAKLLRSFPDADIRLGPDCELSRFVLRSSRYPIYWEIKSLSFSEPRFLWGQVLGIIPQKLAPETRPLASFSPRFIGVERAAQGRSRAIG